MRSPYTYRKKGKKGERTGGGKEGKNYYILTIYVSPASLRPSRAFSYFPPTTETCGNMHTNDPCTLSITAVASRRVSAAYATGTQTHHALNEEKDHGALFRLPILRARWQDALV
jgi:hypothetical protein